MMYQTVVVSVVVDDDDDDDDCDAKGDGGNIEHGVARFGIGNSNVVNIFWSPSDDEASCDLKSSTISLSMMMRRSRRGRRRRRTGMIVKIRFLKL
jgi:hypothetical protein